MERKLRSKFILVSMTALTVVLILLFGSINLANFVAVTGAQDKLLASIASEEGEFDIDSADFSENETSPMPMESELRFFVVSVNKDGETEDLNLDFVSSVSAEDAEAYAQVIWKSGRTSGYYKNYRYYVLREDEDATLYFLNCSSELKFSRSLLLLSLLISLLALAVMSLLVFILSRRAISPFIKNSEAQKQFLTNASHELKTPLVSISTSAEVLALSDEENEWVQNIQCQTSRLSRLVNNLVTMLRLEEADPFPEKEVFVLSDALWESIEPYLSIAKAKGRFLTQNIEEDLQIYGNKTAIQQMFSVLLDNAVTYSNEGGTIRIHAFRQKKKCVIRFFNTCEPIDSKNLDRLFERFYRADTARSGRNSGSGIGLSIARAIANAHSGEISVESKSKASICFTVTLPAKTPLQATGYQS